MRKRLLIATAAALSVLVTTAPSVFAQAKDQDKTKDQLQSKDKDKLNTKDQLRTDVPTKDQIRDQLRTDKPEGAGKR